MFSVRIANAVFAIICGIVTICTPALAQDAGESLAETHGGEIRAGIWFNSDVGPQANFTLLRPQFLASSATFRLGFDVNRYEAGVAAGLSVTDAFGTGWSQDVTLRSYSAKARPALASDVTYSGADVAWLFGKELDGGVSLKVGPGYQIIHVDPTSDLPQAIAQDIAVSGAISHGGFITLQAALNRVEPVSFPSQGFRVAGGLEAGRLGATSYSKLTLSGEVYGRIASSTAVRAHARFARGFSSGENAFPVFKNFTSAGMSDLRGFAAGGIGPVSTTTTSLKNSHVGGSAAFFAGVEVARPIRADEKLALLGFVDVGAITNGSDVMSDLSQSIGIGLRWESPVGPLNLAVSKPIEKKATDLTETMQVSFGLTF